MPKVSKKNTEKQKNKKIKEHKGEKEEVNTSEKFINNIKTLIDKYIKNLNTDNKYDEKIVIKFKKFIKYINKYIEKKNKELYNKQGFIKYPDGSTYTGELINNIPHGTGKYVKDNNTFEGQFKKGILDGCGKITTFIKKGYSNRKKDYYDVYEGELKYVEGTYHKHGQGKIIYERTGEIIEGSWKDDLIHGEASYFYKEKESYKGQWVKDIKHGYGEFFGNLTKREIYKNSYTYYKGEFKYEVLDGVGESHHFHKNEIYQGNFCNGLKHGKGKLTNPDTLPDLGSIKESKGKLTITSGTVYEGMWKNGLPDGDMKKTESNGKISYLYYDRGILKDSKDYCPPAVNVFILQIDTFNKKYRFDNNEWYDLIEDTMPILPHDAKFGDIVEWKAKSGYRMTGLYQIGLCNGKLVLKDIDYNYDDYGSIASFVNAADFPNNWEEIPLVNAYPHGYAHAVAVHIKSLDLDGISTHYSGNIRIPIITKLETGPKFIHLSEDEDKNINKIKKELIKYKENYCVYVRANDSVKEEDGTETKIFYCEFQLEGCIFKIDRSNEVVQWKFESYNYSSGEIINFKPKEDIISNENIELISVKLPLKHKHTKGAISK